MRFQCQKQECKKTFHYPMKIRTFEEQTPNFEEIMVCPYCKNKDFAEYLEPAIAEPKVTNVLVVDLIPGENLALNKALADGYQITARYAKQFILEKKEVIEK